MWRARRWEQSLAAQCATLHCLRARALLRLREPQRALASTAAATALSSGCVQAPCLAALAYTMLGQAAEAAEAAGRVSVLRQRRRCLVQQRPLLARFVAEVRREPTWLWPNLYPDAESPFGRATQPAPPRAQPSLGIPFEMPPREWFPMYTAVRRSAASPNGHSGHSGACGSGGFGVAFSLLASLFEYIDVRGELLRAMPLHATRAAGCVCWMLREHVHAHLRAPQLCVSIQDATYDNAAFVGRLPGLARLTVESLPRALDISHLRSLTRVNVKDLSFEGALFLGGLLAGGEQTVRVSSGSCVRLPPLRTRERLNLSSRGLTDSDLAVLLGALALNVGLKELDLASNPAPEGPEIKAAVVGALPWGLLERAFRNALGLAGVLAGIDAHPPPPGLE